MITNKMQNAINDQINAELWSAYLYLSMAMDAEAKAWKGIANWFRIQWLEEQDHATIFQNYLNDSGSKVRLQPIDGVQQEWPSPLVMYQDTLEHEKEVTKMIGNLVKTALNDGDFATLSRLQYILGYQWQMRIWEATVRTRATALKTRDFSYMSFSNHMTK